MKKFLLSVFTSFIFLGAIAQKQADKWYFGNGAALDFSSGTPSVIASGNGSYMPSEGCSVISDGSGNLMFYTDGMNVYDKTHSLMANGSGLMGGLSSTQAALIVPQPGSNGIYYIFTTDDYAGANGLRYSVVDMNLASSNGSVTIKNALLMTPMTEKVTAVKDPFNNRYWILAHQWNSSSFNAYALTSSGIAAPVISSIGAVHSGSLQNTYGQMKFNPCGNKVALTVGYQDIWELFDFNTNTGIVSNPVTFYQTDHVYGIEFSPESSKIYVSTYDVNKTLVQYDLSLTNTVAIAVSETTISATPSIYGLQLGNDGKVYVCKSFSQYLGVINSPSVAGVGCNYNDTQVDFDPTFSTGITVALSLPGFPQNYFLPTGFVCPTVTTDLNEISVKDPLPAIYPNPSVNDFSIHTYEARKFEVYSYTGKLIETLVSEKNSTIKFGENYAKGIYFVKGVGERTDGVKVIKQ
jgi:hypothetical protein